jgi:hypothetical protein
MFNHEAGIGVGARMGGRIIMSVYFKRGEGDRALAAKPYVKYIIIRTYNWQIVKTSYLLQYFEARCENFLSNISPTSQSNYTLKLCRTCRLYPDLVYHTADPKLIPVSRLPTWLYSENKFPLINPSFRSSLFPSV